MMKNKDLKPKSTRKGQCPSLKGNIILASTCCSLVFLAGYDGTPNPNFGVFPLPVQVQAFSIASPMRAARFLQTDNDNPTKSSSFRMMKPTFHTPSTSLSLTSVTSTMMRRKRPPLQPLHASKTDTSRESTGVTEQDMLSDVDAQVLRSLLEDNLDLATEGNLKKMLERDEEAKTKFKKKKTASERSSSFDENSSSSSSATGSTQKQKYASKTLKTIKDNTFWNSLRAKADEIVESAQLFIQNRIERDTQLTIALGIFTFDRIKKDVARALPSTSTFRKSVLKIAASSSFVKVDESKLEEDEKTDEKEKTLYDEFNTPADEVRQVSQSIKQILNGDFTSLPTTSSSSGLRSLAPAGSVSNSERQRRAYARQKKTKLAREKDSAPAKFGRMAGSVSSTAYQLTKEIQVEKPGYRSEGVRKALLQEGQVARDLLQEGGKRVMGRLKRGKAEYVMEGDREEEAMKNAANMSTADRARLYAKINAENVKKEKARLASALKTCLDDPSKTWLKQDLKDVQVDGEALGEVITSMVALRKDLEKDIADANTLDGETFENDVNNLQNSVQIMLSRASLAAGNEAANLLKSSLVGDSMILSMEKESTQTIDSKYVDIVTGSDVEDKFVSTGSGTKTKEPKSSKSSYFDAVIETTDAPESFEDYNFVNEDDKAYSGFNSDLVDYSTDYDVIVGSAKKKAEKDWQSAVVEIVGDDEEVAVNVKAESVAVDEIEEKEQKENLLATLTLRSIDVVLFLAEKILLVSL